MSAVIRPMQADDIDQIFAIEGACFAAPWSIGTWTEVLVDPYTYNFVLEEDGTVLGYGLLWVLLDESHVINIAVDPSRQGEGFGRQLMEHLIAIAASLGIMAMTLEVRESNIAARALYESLGFEVAGRRPNYYQAEHEDGLIMWRYERNDDDEDLGN